MDSRGNDENIQASEGTGNWLLEHHLYDEWRHSDQPLLWLKGNPGSGKSTLLKRALEDAKASQQATLLSSTTMIASFFFYAQGTELQKSPLGFFRTVLYQLLSQRPSAFSRLVSAYKDKCKKFGSYGQPWSWTKDDLKEALMVALRKIGQSRPVKIFVDALDEACDGTAVGLVQDLKEIAKKVPGRRFKILFTCRNYPVISLNEPLVIQADEHNEKDIATYVDTQLQRLSDETGTNMEALRPCLVKPGSSLFVWVALAVKRVEELCLEGHSLEKIVSQLEKYPANLDQLYEQAFENMRDDKEYARTSLKLMQWMRFAKDPLKLDHIRVALVIDGSSRLENAEEVQKSDEYIDNTRALEIRIRHLSKGLIEVKAESDPQSSPEDCDGLPNRTLAFIHQTVLDFVVDRGLSILDDSIQDRALQSQTAHLRISKSCLCVLAMPAELDRLKKDLGAELFWDTKNDKKYAAIYGKVYDFFSYARRRWSDHEEQSSSGDQAHIDLLEFPGRPFDLSLWSLVGSNALRSKEGRSLNVGSLLQLAVGKHWTTLVNAIISRYSRDEISSNWAGENYQSPLAAAVRDSDDLEIIELLMQRLSLDVNGQGDLFYDTDFTPLTHAVVFKKLEVVKWFIERPEIQVNMRDSRGTTPLACAVVKASSEKNAEEPSIAMQIFELLLHHKDIDVRMTSHGGHVPFIYAACVGNARIVKQIMEREDIRGKQGPSESKAGTEEGSSSETGVTDSRNRHLGIKNMSALLDQAGKGQSEDSRICTQALGQELSRPDVNVNDGITNIHGDFQPTPLVLAVKHGNLWAIEALLNSAKVDPSVRCNLHCSFHGDKDGTALCMAFSEEMFMTAAVLVGSGRFEMSMLEMTLVDTVLVVQSARRLSSTSLKLFMESQQRGFKFLRQKASRSLESSGKFRGLATLARSRSTPQAQQAKEAESKYKDRSHRYKEMAHGFVELHRQINKGQ